jgi:hypothetical protein
MQDRAYGETTGASREPGAIQDDVLTQVAVVNTNVSRQLLSECVVCVHGRQRYSSVVRSSRKTPVLREVTTLSEVVVVQFSPRETKQPTLALPVHAFFANQQAFSFGLARVGFAEPSTERKV